MSLPAGARPKRKSKKMLDPDFQCELPSSAFLHNDLNLKEPSNPATYDQSTKQSTQSSKPKSAATLSASSSPITINDTASSAPSFDQQLQLLKLKEDKLELELKVMTISRQERPPDNTLLFKMLRRSPSLNAISVTSIGHRILFLLFKVNTIKLNCLNSFWVS